MNYKHFVVWFTGISIFLIVSYCAVLCIIDSLGIFNIISIKGINNYKGVQNNYIDVWKPYEIKDKKPDIIFIGSSRVLQAVDVRSYKADCIVYNAGFSGLSIKDMDAYIDMICKVKKPKKIYIGLDLFQFGNNSFLDDRSGFSMNRLNNVINKGNTIFLCKMQDSLSIDSKNIIRTINGSMKNINERSDFVNGYYNNDYNVSLSVDKLGYYGSLNQYNREYMEWAYSHKSMECLKKILEKADQNDIEVIVYFNPVSIELMSLMRIYKLDDDLERIKREVTSICGVVYDFNFVNKYIIDKKFFTDASHANRLFGNLIISNLQMQKDSVSMLVLTNQNIEKQMEKEKCSFDNWKKNNLDYFISMEKKLKGNKKVKVGDFKEFIGF